MPSLNSTAAIESQSSRPGSSSGSVSALEPVAGVVATGHVAGDRRPARDRLVGRPADDLVGRQPRDRLGRAVPEADDPVAIEHEDAVADVLEHAGRVGAPLRLGEQERVVDRDRGPARELLAQ